MPAQVRREEQLHLEFMCQPRFYASMSTDGQQTEQGFGRTEINGAPSTSTESCTSFCLSTFRRYHASVPRGALELGQVVRLFHAERHGFLSTADVNIDPKLYIHASSSGHSLAETPDARKGGGARYSTSALAPLTFKKKRLLLKTRVLVARARVS